MKTLILTAAALMAAPVLAQTTPAPDTSTAPAVATNPGKAPHRPGKRLHHPIYGAVSPEGRQTLAQALRGNRDHAAATSAARDKINNLMGAEKLDVPALKKAMEDERRLIEKQHMDRQERLLTAVQKLSAADRKAFAEQAQRGRRHVEHRMDNWRRTPAISGDGKDPR